MFNFFRKENKISETKAVGIFLESIFKIIDLDWEKNYQNLKLIPNFEFQHEDNAKYELLFALISLENKSLYNLFAHHIANRVETKILNLLMETLGKEFIQGINFYSYIYESAIEEKRNPVSYVAIFLFKHWNKNKLSSYAVEIEDQEVVNPMVQAQMEYILITQTGFWRRFKNRFELVEK